MSRCVVDTNVAIVANGRSNDDGQRTPSIQCRLAAVTLLQKIVKNGTILLDAEHAIQTEYRRHLNPSGAPGVGDRFFLVVLQSSPSLVERIGLPQRPDGEYEHCPQPLIDAGFDPSDRKFAALACKENGPVYNAIDSDWLEHAHTLNTQGIQVVNLCGCDANSWYT